RRGLRRSGGRNRGRNHAKSPLFGQAHRRTRQGQSHGEDSAQIADCESAPLQVLGTTRRTTKRGRESFNKKDSRPLWLTAQHILAYAAWIPTLLIATPRHRLSAEFGITSQGRTSADGRNSIRNGRNGPECGRAGSVAVQR